jgi:hypothetical protein
MRRELLHTPAARRIEKAVVVCALLGSVWAGQRLMQRFNRPAPPETAVAQPTPAPETAPLGEDVFRAAVLRYLPDNAPGWAATQRKLTARLPTLLRRKVTLDMVYVIPPLLMYPLTDFIDYELKPLLPKAGTVVKLNGEPSCIQFVWNTLPMQGVIYTLEIAKKREFVFYRSFGADDMNTVRVQVQRGSDFFWRVRAAVGRQQMVSEAFSFLVMEPALKAEDLRLRELATRARDSSAWLNDLSFCHSAKKTAKPVQ